MTLVVKATSTNPTIATISPSNNHRIGPFGDTPGDRSQGAGEDLDFADFCYVGSGGRVLRAIEDQTGTSAAINDVQTTSYIYPFANASGGGFVLGYKGQYTATIPYNASSATVQTAIQALSTVGAGNITVSGSNLAFVFTGASTFAGTELNLIEVYPSIVNNIDPTAATGLGMKIVHTTVGQPIGASGAEQSSSRVRGVCTIRTKRGQPVTLYDCVIIPYSDGNLTPGADLFLSGITPGGLDTARTLTAQNPVAFAMDTQRIYVFAIR